MSLCRPDEGQYQQQQCAPPFNSHGTRNHLGNGAAVSDAPFAVQNNMQPQHDYCRTAENGVSAHFSNMHDQRFQFSHTHTPAVSDAQYSVQMDEGRQYGYYTHQSVEQHGQPAPTLPYPYNPSDATTQHGYVQPAINTETIEHRVQQPQKASSQQHFYPSSLTQYKYPQGQQGYPDSAVIQQPEAPVDPYYRNGAGGVAVAETIPNYQQHYDWSNQENYGYPQSQGNNVYGLQQGNTLEQQYIQYTQPHQQGVVAQTLITASQSAENSHISSVSYQQYRPS